ncbi:unnamed protein product [Agarophyton chilense]|eukprot:gb/GEZJ01002471.1/.p1 GENE.gb/GEZJ01002471.1/~~gb/GEZJ01002471.1/.p1  ORF type:complete len:774 (+),score=82.14 gb/GEZJ01002471.1/:2188-4509(+)
MNTDLVDYARGLLPSHHIYADWAASALSLPAEPPCFIPPHHAHRNTLRRARKALSGFLHDSKQNHFIVFTSGTTASFELLADRLPWSSNSTFICHTHAHNSLLGLRNIAISNGAKFVSFNTEEFGSVLNQEGRPSSKDSFAVFAFPGECNLTGSRYPLEWVSLVKKFGVLNYSPSQVITLVDTAKLVATGSFSLDDNPDIDALVFSLYKLSATHTGLGALIIRNKSLLHHLLQTTASTSYFAGGRSLKALTPFSSTLFTPADDPTEFLQLGTPNMNAINALPTQLAYFSPEVMKNINENTSIISRHFVNQLKEAFPSSVIHRDTSLDPQRDSGTTSVTFFRDNGDTPIGHNEVGTILSINKVFARTGCMCNAGACASVLGLSDMDIIRHHRKGHRCGDEMDLIDGRPTGVVRFSFGWASKKIDADTIVRILRSYLVSNVLRPVPNLSRTSAKFRTTDLFIYPVKGCEGSSVDVLFVDGMGGVVGDRAFGILDFESERILDVRQSCELTNISCSYIENGSILALTTSKRQSQKLGVKELITVEVSTLPELERNRIENRRLLDGGNVNEKCKWVPKLDYSPQIFGSDSVHEWLSIVVDRRVHLVRMHSGSEREKANVLTVSMSELEQLRKESGIESLCKLRSAIRPNIVLERTAISGSETNFRQAPKCVCHINQLERFWNNRTMLRRTRSCTRCEIVNIIAKAYGVGRCGEPLRSIVRLSRLKNEHGVVFGSLMKFMALSSYDTMNENALSQSQERNQGNLCKGDELQGDYYSHD